MIFGRSDRRGSPADLLVLGLGNPGKEYERTRHNVGAEAVALLASRSSTALKASKERALVAEVRMAGKLVVLAFPTTFMNLSGEAATRLVRRHGIETPEQLVVVHDELDLPPGGLKVKQGGGLAGNNGLRSITQHLKTQDYLRVRIGVGKPPSKEHGANHVLSRIGKAERELLDVVIQRAADAVESIAAVGVEATMNEYNRVA